MRNVYLVRHAESAPDPKLPEPDWPLSQNGVEQSKQLIPILRELNVSSIFSSPYPRALNTLQPYAESIGLQPKLINDFRERKLTDGIVDDFLIVLKKAWDDFNFKLPGCESSNECQARFVGAFNKHIVECGETDIAIASHGNAIGLFLNSLDPSFGFEEWRTIGNPDIFKINILNNEVTWDKSFSWKHSSA